MEIYTNSNKIMSEAVNIKETESLLLTRPPCEQKGHCNVTSLQNGDHRQPFEDGQLLAKLVDIVVDNKLTLRTTTDKVVNFKHPAELQKLFPLTLNESGCQSMEEIEDVLEQVVKYAVKTAHPHFYNQLYGGVDEVSLAAAWLLEALNTNQYTYEVAPLFVLMEKYVINLLGKLFGFPDADGLFSPGGSTSNMYGIILARHQRYPEIKETGMFGRRELVMLTSDMSHYSIKKAGAWMGYGTNQIEKIPTDEFGRMKVNDLTLAIQKIREQGREPFFVNATAGTTVFGAFDPLNDIADVCEREGLWLHVDACWGGGVVMSNKYNNLLKGIGRADSIAWNPHKMLCVALQCSAFIVKHKGLLKDCNKMGASYIFQTDKFYDSSFDVGDKSVQCGRKPDVLKLWLMFKIHGLNTISDRVDKAFAAAKHLENEINRRVGFRLAVGERDCTNVCFWYFPPSLRNQKQDQDWWLEVHKVAPTIKARMAKCGSMLIGYQPVECKNLVNFFRMVTTAYPVSTKEDMNFVLDEINRLGQDL